MPYRHSNLRSLKYNSAIYAIQAACPEASLQNTSIFGTTRRLQGHDTCKDPIFETSSYSPFSQSLCFKKSFMTAKMWQTFWQIACCTIQIEQSNLLCNALQICIPSMIVRMIQNTFYSETFTPMHILYKLRQWRNLYVPKILLLIPVQGALAWRQNVAPTCERRWLVLSNSTPAEFLAHV